MHRRNTILAAFVSGLSLAACPDKAEKLLAQLDLASLAKLKPAAR